MKRLLPFLVLFAVAGCDPKSAGPATAPSTAPGGSQASGIRPMTPGSAGIPNAPVAGTESVEGAGMGGLGQSAMGKARSVAGAASAAGTQTGASGAGASGTGSSDAAGE